MFSYCIRLPENSQSILIVNIHRLRVNSACPCCAILNKVVLWPCRINVSFPYHPIDNIRVMVIVWRNIVRAALRWVVWHSVHSQQHTYMSSSYRSSRFGLSHLDAYAVHRGGCFELYYCNMVEWCWWDSFKPYLQDQLVSFSALTLLVWSYDL